MMGNRRNRGTISSGNVDERIENKITQQVIGAAIDVHRQLGSGLLESVDEECLTYELNLRETPFERQKPIAVEYKTVHLDCGFRVDLLVSNLVVVEIKAVDQIAPIHLAQVMTYLRLTGRKLGLLINLNTNKLIDGVRRVANDF